MSSKQEDIAKKHNSLLVEHDELEDLKNNMNEYMESDETEKKETVIGAIKKKRVKNKKPLKENKKRLKEFER